PSDWMDESFTDLSAKPGHVVWLEFRRKFGQTARGGLGGTTVNQPPAGPEPDDQFATDRLAPTCPSRAIPCFVSQLTRMPKYSGASGRSLNRPISSCVLGSTDTSMW